MQQPSLSHQHLQLVALLCCTLLLPISPESSPLAPECSPEGHRILHNPHRSTSFDSLDLQRAAIQDLVCDHSLPHAWYRFMIHDRPAEMPTKCIEMNKCGTQAPVWLSLGSEALPAAGERKQLTACATWRLLLGGAQDCCVFRVPVAVRNCGAFLVYRLPPTQGCMGYCAEVKLMSLALQPVITPKLVANHAHLQCVYERPSSGQGLRYEVLWSRLSDAGAKEEIRRDSTQQPFSYLEVDGVHLRLGDTVFCTVTAFMKDTPDQQSLPEESSGFYAGIKFLPESLQIAEDGKEHVLTILSTVPITCSRNDDSCKITLQLSTEDLDNRLVGPPDVVLSSCQVDLHPTACTASGCAAAALTVTAVTDFARDGDRVTHVRAKVDEGSEPLWRAYTPTDVQVTVQDLPTGNCYSFTDPHIITFDGWRYDNSKTGTFLLCGSARRAFAVHARQRRCGRPGAACTCGVAARDGDDVALLDLCGPARAGPRLRVRRGGARVLAAYGGRKITLLFPSGAFVRADVSAWGMSVTVRAPSSDFNGTRGLCGTFDGDGRNEAHGADGRPWPSNAPHEDFIEEWRIPPGKSLFDKTPAPSEGKNRKKYCRCQKVNTKSLHSVSTLSTLQNSVPPSLGCHYENVDYTSAIPYIDVTTEFVSHSEMESPLGNRKPLAKPFHWKYLPKSVKRRHSRKHQLKPLTNISMKRQENNSFINFTKATEKLQRAKRQDNYYEHSSFYPLQSPSQTDSESFAYFFPEDYFEGSRTKHPLAWPTPNGLTYAKALEICHQILANSTIGLACKVILGKQMDEAIDMCLSDLQLKDDVAWVTALIAFLENECERRVLGNRSRIFHVGNQPSASQQEILTVLRCPAFCNGNGQCTDRGCRCFEDHSSYDCSIARKHTLEITGLAHGGLCDIRVSDCSRIRVFGLGFKDSHNLHCKVTRLIHLNGEWISREQETTKADFLSSKAVDCQIPLLNVTGMEAVHLVAGDEPFARWQVKITNDGFQYSNSKVLTLYDAVCQACEFHPTGVCKLKENTCNIDGLCYGEGESSPASPCLLCEPNTSKFAWSINRNNLPPVFQAPSSQLLTFTGENFVYQLVALDPEGSAVLFILEAGPQDARLSPAGLLIWKVVSEETQTFEFTVSDECNAQSRYSIEVLVKPCSCSNGGTCVTNIKFPPGLGEYLCLCPNGFDGEFCQQDINECKSNPCGSGVCVDSVDSFVCKCPPGLEGLTCQEDRNECKENLCFPGVSCLNTFGSYICGICPPGMEGDGKNCKSVLAADVTEESIIDNNDGRGDLNPTEVEWLLQPLEAKNSPAVKSINRSDTQGHPAPPSYVTTCANRPCFPGVPCFDRKPPYIGYFCGRCPAGFFGNGRVCTKVPRSPVPRSSQSRMDIAERNRDDATRSHQEDALQIPQNTYSLLSQAQLPRQEATYFLGRNPMVISTPSPTIKRKFSQAQTLSAKRNDKESIFPEKQTFLEKIKISSDTQTFLPHKEPEPKAATLSMTTQMPPHFKQSKAVTVQTASSHLKTNSSSFFRSPHAVQRIHPKRGYSPRKWLSRITVLKMEPPQDSGREQQRTSPLASHLASSLHLTGSSFDTAPSHANPPSGPLSQARLLAQTTAIRKAEDVARGHLELPKTTSGTQHQKAICENIPCFPGVECKPAKDGGSTCGPCPPGYSGNGTTCEVLCDPPCEHGGTCVSQNTCSCAYGFVGPRCETMVCSRHCHNGGICVSPDECKCKNGWSSPSCETAVCNPVCLNGGICVRPDTCMCPYGFYGPQCQTAVCVPPCKNGGHCVRTNVCSCSEGYMGRRCQKSVCDPMCMNGGKCVSPNVCDCPSGWKGKHCNKPVCLHKCLNGGECTGPNICECSGGWTGMRCQTPFCEQKCLFGSRCIRPNICACRSGYTGSACGRKLPIG